MEVFQGVPECGVGRRISSSILTEILVLCMDHMIATGFSFFYHLFDCAFRQVNYFEIAGAIV